MNNQPTELRNSDHATENPLVLFSDWMAQAENSEPNDPGAMAIASADASGMPNVRMVLMRRYDERGFCFFTNFESQKGGELQENPKASAVFHWKTLRKQVRLRGLVEEVTKEEADEYFYSRHKGSQIASSVSQQSRVLESREKMMREVEEMTTKIGDEDVVRPAHWSGFRIMPLSIEFWSDGEFRLHDRIRYDRETLDGDWQISRLYP